MAGVDRSAASYYVHNLLGVPQDAPLIKMHAGHIKIDSKHNDSMFFWHFQNQHIADRRRTIIWLNGGPGCSSEDGALMEIGPYRMADKNSLRLNPGSWNKFASLLFVDNPLGTGFSYVDEHSYPRSLPEMASQFVSFLEEFFAIFPDYEQDDIYLAGESYAGQYIPYIAKAIMERNAASYRSSTEPWRIKGLLIGNGWISPKDQYGSFATFAFNRGLQNKDTDEGKSLLSLVSHCQQAMGNSPTIAEYPECAQLRAAVKQAPTRGDGEPACYNVYDIRLNDSYPSCGMNWPPDLEFVTPYLNRPDVASQLHAQKYPGSGWQECAKGVGSALRSAGDQPSIHLFPGLLEEIPILLYSGAEDLICNHIGTENMIESLEWGGAKGFGDTSAGSAQQWTLDGELAGVWQEARNLTYVLFYNSSHMVPFDHPRRSQSMLHRFIGVEAGDPTGSFKDTSLTGNGVGAYWLQKTDYANDGLSNAMLSLAIISAAAFGYVIFRRCRDRARYCRLPVTEV
ncbi:hypothetical protein NLG97_g2236 [Lecanicillium saksenae]|uniref:Uncharacterized protein n=1 Tax=Lecanicillium saksenae TaxID=468837 RepID=A0ACC1R4X4_9HYPO|nr:hypothetical protein NLG97_g2236 [Lecanicillium saksenae]